MGRSGWHAAVGRRGGKRPRFVSAATEGAPVLLLGSHLDTVPHAGRYDGILGVMIAVAVVARLDARGEKLPFGIEVLGFGDEEGMRFGRTLLGSCAVAGTWDDAWWGLTDASGKTLREAFIDFGLDPENCQTPLSIPRRSSATSRHTSSRDRCCSTPTSPWALSRGSWVPSASI